MASKSLDSAARGKDSSTFVNDYLADWDDDDPFRSPSPDPARNDKEQEKKKDVLGIEQQLDLKRKPRAPRVKLDETRLVTCICLATLALITDCISTAASSRIRGFQSCERWRRDLSSKAKDTRYLSHLLQI